MIFKQKNILNFITLLVGIFFINAIPVFAEKQAIPFKKGEKLIYNVKYKGLKIGTSFLEFHGTREYKGQDVYFITFFTDTIYLKDKEKIFAEKQKLLPLKVEREIRRNPGFTTKITELYDQEKYKVEINKKGFIGTDTNVINKSSPIHNAILVSYYFRMLEGLKEIDNFVVNFPPNRFTLSFKGKEIIETPIGRKEALVFKGQPYSFKFWLEDTKKKVPLKIEDPGVFGYSLVLREIRSSN